MYNQTWNIQLKITELRSLLKRTETSFSDTSLHIINILKRPTEINHPANNGTNTTKLSMD